MFFHHLIILTLSKYYRFHDIIDNHNLDNHKCTASHYLIPTPVFRNRTYVIQIHTQHVFWKRIQTSPHVLNTRVIVFSVQKWLLGTPVKNLNTRDMGRETVYSCPDYTTGIARETCARYIVLTMYYYRIFNITRICTLYKICHVY